MLTPVNLDDERKADASYLCEPWRPAWAKTIRYQVQLLLVFTSLQVQEEFLRLTA